MAENYFYSKDGTVDYQGNPANRNKTGTWKACPFIIGNECCERLAYYGMSSNLVRYFKHRLNQHSSVATRNNQNWSGTCYITPLIGAFLADAYLGRYWTIALFSIIYVFGMTLLALSATVHGIRPRCYAEDNCNPTVTQSAVFFVALYMVALGTGGIKPCVSSYGADQFDDTDEAEKKHKSSFFNWFYFSINIGALIASSVLVWVQDNVSWGWGFGIPAIAMAVAVAFFFSGTRLYRNQKPGGSPLTRLCQVVVASFRKLRVAIPADKSLLYETVDAESNIRGSRKVEHTEDLSFFDKAAVETESDHIKGTVDPWRLCTVTQVEELKAGIRLLPIWATGIIFAAVYSQNYRPGDEKMHWSQEWPNSTSADGNWSLHINIRHGCAEVFTLIGQLEFFYEQAPDAMRSFCSALQLTTIALGNYLSSLLVTIVTSITARNGKLGWIPDNLNYGHIQYFFWLLAVLSVLNLGAFLLIAKWYTYKRPVGTLR
ncbi:hypothetical protein V6N11_026321 [Hibiscus sabdariffa]|uniref:Uncharacterized protein n=1 Tax=Hibiscus sabdariffa TaxID=183260 RepID=A0ABR2SVC8_9ROSI